MPDYLTNTSELTSIANAIRTKGGTSSGLIYPQGFVSAIEAISSGGLNGWVDISDQFLHCGVNFGTMEITEEYPITAVFDGERVVAIAEKPGSCISVIIPHYTYDPNDHGLYPTQLSTLEYDPDFPEYGFTTNLVDYIQYPHYYYNLDFPIDGDKAWEISWTDVPVIGLLFYTIYNYEEQ